MSNVEDASSLSANAPPARLLVVDDLAINRDLIQAILVSGGYRLVLMDVRMPNLDGIEAAVAMRALPA